MADTDIIHPDGHTSAERIPGERDATTLTHRQPGAIGGRPNGADIPAGAPDWEDDTTGASMSWKGVAPSATVVATKSEGRIEERRRLM